MRFLLFGASTTFGYCDPEFGGWATRLQFYVDTKLGGRYFHNLAISGNTTKDLLRRMQSEAKERIGDKPPEICTILFSFGANDSSELDGSVKVPVVEYENNLRTLLFQAQELASLVFVVGGFPVLEDVCNPFRPGLYFRNKNILEYSQVQKSVCSEVGVPFLSVYETFLSHPQRESLYFTDGLHLNAKGHEFFFELVKNFLETIQIKNTTE